MNLIFPNFYLVARTIWPDLKEWFQEKINSCCPKKEDHRHEDVFEKKRLELIELYNLKLKEEFKNHDDEEETSDEEQDPEVDFDQ